MFSGLSNLEAHGRAIIRSAALGISAAFLLAAASSPALSQGKGESQGPMATLNNLCSADDPDVLQCRVVKRGGIVARGAREDLPSKNIRYPKGGAVELNYDTSGDEIRISGTLSKEALGISDDQPIRMVIPSVLVRIGEGTCYQDCSGNPGGSSECECVCVGGGTCP